MGNDTVRGQIIKKEFNMLLQNVLDVLQAEDGKRFEEKKDIVIRMLKQTEEKNILAKTPLTVAAAENEGHQIQERFWRAGEEIQADQGIVLRKANETDREHFLDIRQEYAAARFMMKNEEYRNIVWQGHLQEKSMMFSIISENKYAGYCGIENITNHPWEISIELQPEKVHQGIGSIAIRAMLDALRSRLGVSEYRIRIEPTNYASQRLFEKLGAVPNGISELWIHASTELEQLEQESMHLIDERLKSVAERFSVVPRELLSHVLEYKLLWQ